MTLKTLLFIQVHADTSRNYDHSFWRRKWNAERGTYNEACKCEHLCHDAFQEKDEKRWGFWNISIAQVFWNWIRKNHVTGALILRCPNNVRIRHRHLRNRWNNVLMILFFYLSDGQSSNKFSWINNLCLLLYYQSDWNNSNSSARNMEIYGFWTAKNVITSPFGKKYLRTFRNMLLLSRHLSITRFCKLFQAIHKT